MSPREDEVLVALDELVEALEQNQIRIKAALVRARALKAERAKGKDYKEIVVREQRPLIVELLRDNLSALSSAGSKLRRAEAKALHDEGLTTEQIAELFGVTRQRISAVLRGKNGNGSRS